MEHLAEQSDTETPDPLPPGYDWRDEPWLDESGITDLEYHQAHAIVAAFAAEPGCDGATEQRREDARVFAFLRPDLMERICKSPVAHEVIRFRVVSAVAMGLAIQRRAWVGKYGSATAPAESRVNRG